MQGRTGTGRRRRGTSLVEMTVAASILVGVLAVAFPAMKTLGDAGDQGRVQSWTQADNRQTLLRVAREVMNGSSTGADDLGNPRLEVLNGNTRVSLTGNLGLTTTPPANGGTQPLPVPTGAFGSTDTYYTKATNLAAVGSGSRGGSRIGRDRSSSTYASEFDAGASRPRERHFTENSRLRFQKILSYAWGADGEPVITWGPWVEYAVQGRTLVRIEGPTTAVVSPNCSGFFIERTAANTLLITLVTERRAGSSGEFATQANHIEVLPKN